MHLLTSVTCILMQKAGAGLCTAATCYWDPKTDGQTYQEFNTQGFKLAFPNASTHLCRTSVHIQVCVDASVHVATIFYLEVREARQGRKSAKTFVYERPYFLVCCRIFVQDSVAFRSTGKPLTASLPSTCARSDLCCSTPSIST